MNKFFEKSIKWKIIAGVFGLLGLLSLLLWYVYAYQLVGEAVNSWIGNSSVFWKIIGICTIFVFLGYNELRERLTSDEPVEEIEPAQPTQTVQNGDEGEEGISTGDLFPGVAIYKKPWYERSMPYLILALLIVLVAAIPESATKIVNYLIVAVSFLAAFVGIPTFIVVGILLAAFGLLVLPLIKRAITSFNGRNEADDTNTEDKYEDRGSTVLSWIGNNSFIIILTAIACIVVYNTGVFNNVVSASANAPTPVVASEDTTQITSAVEIDTTPKTSPSEELKSVADGINFIVDKFTNETLDMENSGKSFVDTSVWLDESNPKSLIAARDNVWEWFYEPRYDSDGNIINSFYNRASVAEANGKIPYETVLTTKTLVDSIGTLTEYTAKLGCEKEWPGRTMNPLLQQEIEQCFNDLFELETRYNSYAEDVNTFVDATGLNITALNTLNITSTLKGLVLDNGMVVVETATLSRLELDEIYRRETELVKIGWTSTPLPTSTQTEIPPTATLWPTPTPWLTLESAPTWEPTFTPFPTSTLDTSQDGDSFNGIDSVIDGGYTLSLEFLALYMNKEGISSVHSISNECDSRGHPVGSPTINMQIGDIQRTVDIDFWHDGLYNASLSGGECPLVIKLAPTDSVSYEDGWVRVYASMVPLIRVEVWPQMDPDNKALTEWPTYIINTQDTAYPIDQLYTILEAGNVWYLGHTGGNEYYPCLDPPILGINVNGWDYMWVDISPIQNRYIEDDCGSIEIFRTKPKGGRTIYMYGLWLRPFRQKD